MGQSESKETRSALSQPLIERELQRLDQGDVALFVYDQVGSTNDEIVQYLSQLDSHGAVVVTADEQIAGRGRLDRSWSSPWGAGIALTIAVPAGDVAGHLSSTPLRAGLAVQQALHEMNIQVKVKWPNDIVTSDGYKLGGLLSVLRDNAVLVGIGLNVSLKESELPTPTSTSLALLGHDIAREELIPRIIDKFRFVLEGENWLSKYEEVSATLGQAVRLHLAGKDPVEGKVVSFDDEGSIQIENDHGTSTFSVGDIEHLRLLDID